MQTCNALKCECCFVTPHSLECFFRHTRRSGLSNILKFCRRGCRGLTPALTSKWKTPSEFIFDPDLCFELQFAVCSTGLMINNKKPFLRLTQRHHGAHSASLLHQPTSFSRLSSLAPPNMHYRQISTSSVTRGLMNQNCVVAGVLPQTPFRKLKRSPRP